MCCLSPPVLAGPQTRASPSTRTSQTCRPTTSASSRTTRSASPPCSMRTRRFSTASGVAASTTTARRRSRPLRPCFGLVPALPRHQDPEELGSSANPGRGGPCWRRGNWRGRGRQRSPRGRNPRRSPRRRTRRQRARHLCRSVAPPPSSPSRPTWTPTGLPSAGPASCASATGTPRPGSALTCPVPPSWRPRRVRLGRRRWRAAGGGRRLFRFVDEETREAPDGLALAGSVRLQPHDAEPSCTTGPLRALRRQGAAERAHVRRRAVAG